MKIAGICANGKEGRLIVKEALDCGPDVPQSFAEIIKALPPAAAFPPTGVQSKKNHLPICVSQEGEANSFFIL